MRNKNICKPYYTNAGQDYLSLMPVGNSYILIIAVMIWLFVVLLSIVEVLLTNNRQILTNFDDKLALGLAALVFSGFLFYLYHDKFLRNKFCLMNNTDPFCEQFNETDCFSNKKSSVLANHFGFGGFIEIGSGFNFLMKRFKKTL